MKHEVHEKSRAVGVPATTRSAVGGARDHHVDAFSGITPAYDPGRGPSRPGEVQRITR